METTERNTQLDAFVQTLNLGPGWKYKPTKQETGEHFQVGSIVHSDFQGEIHFSSNWREPNKVDVSGSYPRDSKGQSYDPYNMKRPSIQCSMSRGSEAVSRDIIRRFLPDYLEYLHKVLTSINSHEAYLDSKSNTGRALAELFPMLEFHDGCRGQEIDTGWGVRRDDNVTLRSTNDGEGPSISAECFQNGGVKIELGGLTVAQASLVLAQVVGFRHCEHGVIITHKLGSDSTCCPQCKADSDKAKAELRRHHFLILDSIKPQAKAHCTCEKWELFEQNGLEKYQVMSAHEEHKKAVGVSEDE